MSGLMKMRLDDFPDWMSPALVKELRQGVRTRAFVTTFLLLQILLAVMVMLVALSQEVDRDQGVLQVINGFFWTLVCAHLLFVMPCRALGALSGEIKANTLELMSLSQLSAWKIVWGKWVSLGCQSLLVLVSVLPYAVVRYFFGSVNLTEDLITFALLMTASALLCAVAVGFSGFPTWIKGLLVFSMLLQLPMAASMVAMSVMGRPFDLWAEWYYLPLILWDVVILGAAGLVMGSDYIAPEAENFAWIKRLMALLLFLPLLIFPRREEAWFYFQTALSVLVWVYVLMESLAKPAFFLPSHHRAVSRLGRLSGSCFYPGWPSAVRYMFLSMAFFLAVLIVVLGEDAEEKLFSGMTWMVSLWVVMLSPCALYVLSPWKPSQRLLTHFLIHLVLGVTAVFLAIMTEIHAVAPIKWLLAVFPHPYCYLVFHDEFLDPGLIIATLISSLMWLLVLGLILRRGSREYWKQVREKSGGLKKKVPGPALQP